MNGIKKTGNYNHSDVGGQGPINTDKTKQQPPSDDEILNAMKEEVKEVIKDTLEKPLPAPTKEQEKGIRRRNSL
ncbi:MAG: hypothetical protein JWO53_382 [Chlamydiia bacterium]|nr:hypothetical protein [Chlamydiia bacterium]